MPVGRTADGRDKPRSASASVQGSAPCPRPAAYDPQRFELLARFLAAFVKEKGRPARMNEILLPREIANGKWDFDNRGPFWTDYIGRNYDCPNTGYARREAIRNDHVEYTKGLLYFLVNDPRVPKETQEEIRQFGIAKDEFTGNENWPYQLYVREARRMVGGFVMTQKDIQTELTKPDVIGMGSYNSDSHNVQRFVTPEGYAQKEGNMEVPVCFSASHVTCSTLRMEPVYMLIGHAAGLAARMAVEKKVAVQDVDTAALTAKLREQGAVMEWKPSGSGDAR